MINATKYFSMNYDGQLQGFQYLCNHCEWYTRYTGCPITKVFQRRDSVQLVVKLKLQNSMRSRFYMEIHFKVVHL